ncbi:PREDICTED: uncharacterized protein LOC107186946 [Dufourea novaeangliae]|uniref:Ig-like domain-containing protein n=1 Tax=Dufourea novaeangliae TaxID=178035 RepID=A0A154PC20_DUFNO|nr:PREDICTED: uncharacterized protein LOC107186946 [Dufourea novaeangliae]KZC08818.1 hypothetical protein WN55_11321 [Dufourea novaeangliae]
MEDSRRQNLKEDDDVSVIAIIGKEKNRTTTQREIVESDMTEDRLQEDPRMFELGDERSKMALRKRLDLEPLSTEQQESTTDYKGIEILQKLPPGTIEIKQDKKYKDDSDYVRDSTESSSGGSTSGATTKLRRVHRATRKNRGTGEIRRNPIRVTKKDPDKDFPRPRKQLLSAKRKGSFFDLEPSKRGRSSTMPYMNTRSVTRKMYNVGATYQAPTVRDEMEWKEWPVHGMHERPVFHPEVGLAAEYLGRYYTSLNGLSYREIVDRPEIEVVSVDPHCDFLPSSGEKKRYKNTRTNRNVSNATNAKASSSGRHKSFQSCMHESFHSVLGYCSQVMTSTYKTNIGDKIKKLNEKKNLFSIAKEPEKQFVAITAESIMKNELSITCKENSQKPVETNKMLDNYPVTMMSQNIKTFNQVPKTRLFPAQKVYVANSQRSIAFTNLKTFQGRQMKIQDMVRPSNNPLILVNTSESKDAQILRPLPNNMNLIKLEDTVSNESLFDIPSVCKNAIPSDDQPESSKAKQATMKRGNKVEFTVTKYLLDSSQQTKNQVAKEMTSSETKLSCDTASKDVNTKTVPDGLTKTWCTNDASEIAKILSEYNKSSTKKPAIGNQGFYTNLKNMRVKTVSNKDEGTKQCAQENSLERNVNVTFPQGKWRRFHFTVEKMKDIKGGLNEKKLLSAVSNRQSLFKIDQATVDSTSEKKTEDLKHLEPAQKSQSSATNVERKENISMNNVVDATAMKTHSLQELLENTAILYCAATGSHQDDLANYIDSLDAAQSIEWLETCKNLTIQ